MSTLALGATGIALCLRPSACHCQSDTAANPVYTAFDPGVCQAALEASLTPGSSDAQVLYVAVFSNKHTEAKNSTKLQLQSCFEDADKPD
jgi:hypothetical protein